MPQVPDGERRFTSRDLVGLAGISYRQVDYWCRLGILEPDWRRSEDHGFRRTANEGSGYVRVFTAAELIKAQVMAQMLHDGIGFQHARRAIAAGQQIVHAALPLPDLPDLPGDEEVA